MSNTRSICWCPASWAAIRRQFVAGVSAGGGSVLFQENLNGICEDLSSSVLKSGELLLDVPFGSSDEIDNVAQRLWSQGSCLAGLLAGAYACMAVTWFGYDYMALHRITNVIIPLLIFTQGCFEPEVSKWKITSGHVWRQVRGAVMGEGDIDWSLQSVPLCASSVKDQKDTLAGYCGDPMPHRIKLSAAGPLEAIASDDVVLCTHTSLDKLELLTSMMRSWGGAVSIAVFGENNKKTRRVLQAWVDDLGRLDRGLEAAPLRQVVVSQVGLNPIPRGDYDTLYPANLLRQVAIDASVGEWILLADPGFIPSLGFREAVTRNSSLRSAVDAVAASTRAAFLVASFALFETYDGPMGFDDLHALVDNNSAAAFDGTVCPICRPYAWQWLLLMGRESLQFRDVATNDLHHPAFLVSRKNLPRLPGFLHGVVTSRSGQAKTGWAGLPTGLKVLSEQLRALGIKIFLLPQVFLHRKDDLEVPSHHWEDLPIWLPLHYMFDLLMRKVLRTFPGISTNSSTPRTLFSGGSLVEVTPAASSPLFTLKQGTDASLQVLVMASTILGSEGLDILLASVPWTVHAVVVGIRDYWQAALREIPYVLRTFFAPETVIAVVDAYDVMLLPCNRSIVDEYRAYNKSIVWAADTTCHPNREACRTCQEQYPNGSEYMDSCNNFPYLNGGCHIGTAAAIADAYDWIRMQGGKIGRDDQENKWHLYNNNRDKIVLDHAQKIFTCFFGHREQHYKIEGCSVVSAVTGDEVCLAHANGGTKWEILKPLITELEKKGCRPSMKARSSKPYAGMATPRLIWAGT
eukprot:TRINITY_DN34731_c0_g1_i1.p1 TRINITY_DN34731_c0_g1~~TRINITY_DN34731_c0_g1_i1.p1  ORF type:complete len:801 (-),score=117.43 TRINITY_DN34731_c0_g1_i1:112-2514(-)